ncbi:phage virion morphogenesis (putative tail completion) protein [Roseivivax halotolerans]|uniref:Phage virion morphogenesis (Putative tail completion) protein n=1 Tax=Roseivivax halotolerans TaxID=93684 RepID=A0A1I5W3P0_9RHOB|nr:phage virion morphogenesis protein [Roseivivax halotolerans]SFQ14362.1 phage virion morphogenesis (putative tail completion) protein [Roseivivax halotolerans]
MSGVVLSADFDFGRAADAIARLADPDIDELAFNVGQLLETQSRTRISDEKVAPGGAPWAAWSADYAATRSAQHSLLVGENDLLESVQNYSAGAEAKVGTNLVYGAIHQFGGEPVGMPIPARPYLGVSDENAAEIEDLVIDYLEELL